MNPIDVKKAVILEIQDESKLPECLQLIREAFVTVAREYGLTEANCPSNPALLPFEKLQGLRSKGVRFYGLYIEDRMAGFVAIEKADKGTYYMEKLAVAPEFRHHGCGERLMDYVCETVKDEGGIKIGIGVMNENTVLKTWYQNYGFRETALKTFPHLPFTVCFMEKEI